MLDVTEKVENMEVCGAGDIPLALKLMKKVGMEVNGL